MGRFLALYMRFYLYETAVDCALQFAVGELGLYSICSVAVTLVDSRTVRYSPLLDLVDPAIYLAVLLYWIVRFLKEQPRRSSL
jgi:hypothetical protein